jgi:RNA polymerase primary sigma factor
MGVDQVEKAIEVLVADFVRQGGELDLDHVNRVLERRGLTGDQATGVLRALREQGIEPIGVDPASLGFEASPDRTAKTGVRNLDGLELFMRDVSRYRLLTASDEVKLGRRIDLARQALDVLGRSLAHPDRQVFDPEASLSQRFRDLDALLQDDDPALHGPNTLVLQKIVDGREAFNQLLLANLRLVVHQAKRHVRPAGLDLLDLVQEGFLGLVRAAEKFDASLGYKFSTYATWWIRQSIGRAVADKGHIVRLPVHVVEKKSQLDRARRSLAVELRREPTSNEIAVQLQWDLADVVAIEDLAKFEVTSLNATVGNEDQELGELIADPFTVDPADIAMAEGLATLLEIVLRDLPDRQRDIIRRRFGLDGNKECTLEEVGQALGVTRERVRQIQVKALKTLRSPKVIRLLSDYGELAPSPTASNCNGADEEDEEEQKRAV